MADFNFLSITFSPQEDLGLCMDDSPDQSSTCPELKAAMDRIFSQSASELLNREYFEDSFEVSTLGSTRVTTKVVSPPLGIPSFLGFTEESLYPTSSAIAGLPSSPSCKTYKVPLCASAPHDAPASCAVPIPEISTLSQNSLSCAEHSTPQNIVTLNETQTNHGLDEAHEEVCAYKNREHEKTAGCDYISSGESNTGTSSDSEDMSRPFVCISQKQRKRKRKKIKKVVQEYCDSNDDDSENRQKEHSSSCTNEDSTETTSSQSERRIPFQEDFHVNLKSDTYNSLPGLFLPVVVLKDLKLDKSSTEDSPHSNFREESLDSCNYDSGSSKVSCYRDREMNDDDVSNISYTSLKDNLPEDQALAPQLPASGEKLWCRQKLPIVKRKCFDLFKDFKKIMKTFFPCYVVVEKVDSLLLCDNENKFGVADNILPVPVRVQILSDLCIQGALVCGIKQKRWGLDLLLYSSLYDGFSEDGMSEEDFAHFPRSRNLRKRDKPVCYVEESDHFDEEDAEELCRENTRKKIKDSRSAADECSVKLKQRKIETFSDGNMEPVSTSGNSLQETEPLKKIRIKMVSKKWGEIRKGHKAAQRLKPASSSKGSVKSLLDKLKLPLNQSEVLNRDKNILINSNFPSSVTNDVFSCTAASALQQPVLSYSQTFNNYIPFATNINYQNSALSTNTGLSQVYPPGLSIGFDTSGGMIPSSLAHMMTKGTYFPPHSSAASNPYLSQHRTTLAHNPSETAMGSTVSTVSLTPVNSSSVSPAQSFYGIPLVNQLQPMQSQHHILPSMHSFGYSGHLASPTANLLSPPLNGPLQSPLANHSQRPPAVMLPTSQFQTAPSPYFITMGTGSVGGNVSYSQGQSSYAAISNYQASNANAISLMLSNSGTPSYSNQLVKQTSQALMAPPVLPNSGQFSQFQAPSVLDVPVPRTNLPLKMPSAQSFKQVRTSPQQQTNTVMDKLSSKSSVEALNKYKQSLNNKFSYSWHPEIYQSGQALSQHNQSSSDPKLHQTLFPSYCSNISQKNQLPSYHQSRGLMLQSNPTDRACSGQAYLPSTQSASQTVHSSSVPAHNLHRLVSTSPNTSTHHDCSMTGGSGDNNRAKDLSASNNLPQNFTLPPPPAYRSPPPCKPPITSTLSDEELRIARRRKLETKYPIPPGVIIKTEPMDYVSEPSSPVIARAPSQQNVVAVPSSSCALPNTFISQAVVNTQSCSSQAVGNTQSCSSQAVVNTQSCSSQVVVNTQSCSSQAVGNTQSCSSQAVGNTQSCLSQAAVNTQSCLSQAVGNTQNCSLIRSRLNQTVTTSTNQARTWHVPISSVFSSHISPPESVEPINLANTTSSTVTASSFACPYQASYTQPASCAPVTTAFSAFSNTYSPCNTSFSAQAILSNNYRPCYSEPNHWATSSTTISHSFNASQANQMPPLPPSSSATPSQFNWNDGKKQLLHSVSSDASAYPPYPLLHSDSQSAVRWSYLTDRNHTSQFIPNQAPFHNMDNNLSHQSTSSLSSCNITYLSKEPRAGSYSMSSREPITPLLNLPSLPPLTPLSSNFSPSVSSTSASSILATSDLTFTNRISHTLPASPLDKTMLNNSRVNKESYTIDKRPSQPPKEAAYLAAASHRLYVLTKIVQTQEASGLKSDRLDKLKRLLYVKRREFNDLRRQALVQSLSLELSNNVNNN